MKRRCSGCGATIELIAGGVFVVVDNNEAYGDKICPFPAGEDWRHFPRAGARRIDSLRRGEEVMLRYAESRGRSYDEVAVFVSMTGEGENRRATFHSRYSDGTLYEWEAYRHETRGWVHGSSADRLSIAR
jgi:hypothetical protein